MDDKGWWSRTAVFGEHVFSARCPVCARFVKVDYSAKVRTEWGGLAAPNATCAKHGRVETPFLGWAADLADTKEANERIHALNDEVAHLKKSLKDRKRRGSQL